MSELMSRRHGPLSQLTGDGWGRGRLLSRRDEPFGNARGVLIAGAVVVGAGLLAWHFLGPDVRRYMKIHSM
jgi:hypothetical protein